MYNHQLDTFLKAAELGSFSKAADALYISVPSLIQQINILEERCGVKLFERSNRGARLTPAGLSLAEDARTIIRLSGDAVARARSLAEASEHTVRIGTSLLYKCRLLPDLWPRICAFAPDLKIEILPLPEMRSREETFAQLGIRIDMWEGIYASTAWEGRCAFLELMRQPICCAVAKAHRLSGLHSLTMEDLNGEYLVMPITGVSKELDDFRAQVLSRFPTIRIIDSPYYGVDTFTLCEINQYILITQPVYADIHTNLKLIPLESDITLPYGLIYATDPSPATRRFVSAAERVRRIG